jgi:hypothetical protein
MRVLCHRERSIAMGEANRNAKSRELLLLATVTLENNGDS